MSERPFTIEERLLIITALSYYAKEHRHEIKSGTWYGVLAKLFPEISDE